MENSVARVDPLMEAKQVGNELGDWKKNGVASLIATGKRLAELRLTMPFQEYKRMVRAQMLVDNATANKLAMIGRHKILSDPANFSKLPAEWAKLYELSFLPDEVLIAKIADGSVKTISKYGIWALREALGVKVKKGGSVKQENPKSLGNLRRRSVRVPEGTTLIKWVRSGMELEKNNALSPGQAADAIGLYPDTYRRTRALLSLADRTDLNDEDDKTVRETMRVVEQDGNIRPHYAAIKPILDRIWGGTSRNRRINIGDGAEKKRTENFARALVVICDTCMNCVDIEVPHLSAEETASAIDRVIEARAALQQLAKKLRRSE